MDEKFCEDAIKRYGELVREKTMKEGIKEGRKELSYEVANDLIDEGYDAKDVSRISRLDISIVNKLILMK